MVIRRTRISAWLLVVVIAVAGLVACSSENDALKFEAALSNGPLKISVDSTGKVNLKALANFELDVFDLGAGVKTAQDRLEEEEHAKKWYVIFQHNSTETAFEFTPKGFLQVKLNGKVVQELRMRITVVKLEPNASAEITAIFHHSTSGSGSPAAPEILIPQGFVGRWQGKVSYFEKKNPLGKGYTRPPRPITVHIPSQEMVEKTTDVPGDGRRTDKVVGTAGLPRDDFTVDFSEDSKESVKRSAENWIYTLAEDAPRPITLSRIYVTASKRDAKAWYSGPVISFTILTDGKLFMEYYEGRDETYPEFAALLTKVST